MFDNVDKYIEDGFEQRKSRVVDLAREGDREGCMRAADDVLSYMNRFRNCELRRYFDEDIHDAIASLQTRSFDTTNLLTPKNTFRIAFVFSRFNESGGAAFPHRLMLEEYNGGCRFEQFAMVTNEGDLDLDESNERYRFMRERIPLQRFRYVEPGLNLVEKGDLIADWIHGHAIDFVVYQPSVSVLYAIATRPALLSAGFSADWYTFTIGPGTGDFTLLMTLDQALKYRFEKTHSGNLKNIALPLPPLDYVEGQERIGRHALGVPETAVVSATTNLWKCCFGDDDRLMTGIGALMRMHPTYHHVFLGTPRCLENVDAFLSQNPDLRGRFHYAGVVPEIYRVLKEIDFYVNSYPTSGASNTEAALCEKPSIDLVSRRDLAGHGPELLRSLECEVISLEEFVTLGNRLISDPEYRAELGRRLRDRMATDMLKMKLAKERIYDMFVTEFHRLLESRPRMPALEVGRTIEVEKHIGIFRKESRSWTADMRQAFVEAMTERFPERPYPWILGLQESVDQKNAEWFAQLRERLDSTMGKDPRILLAQARGLAAFGDRDGAVTLAHRAGREATLDGRIAAEAARILRDCGAESQADNLLVKASSADHPVCSAPQEPLRFYDY